MSQTARLSRISSCKLPTQWGEFIMIGYEEQKTKQEHIALVMGNPAVADSVLVRVHSECLTGDALFSQRCDCGAQLEFAMKSIQQVGCGVIVYLRQEGRGIGLINKIKAYHLQDGGLDTVDANLALDLPVDARNYSIAKDILQDLEIHQIDLMTNNPDKIKILETEGIKILKRVPLQVGMQENNRHYLATKVNKMGHLLDLPQEYEK